MLKLQGSQEDLQVAHEGQISKYTQEKEIRTALNLHDENLSGLKGI